MIRTAWVFVVGVLATVFYGVRIITAAWLERPGSMETCRLLARRWAATICRIAGVRVEIEGAQHLDPRGGQILVANHQSWFDVFAVAAYLPVEYCFVAKQELARVPVFGRAWQACGHIGIDRQDRASAVESLEAARRQIREGGRVVIMFPEGTRSPTGELLPFKKGAFVLAIQAGAPLVPMGILGSRRVMPKGSWRIRAGTVRLRIGPPIEVQGLRLDQRDVLLDRSRQEVAALARAGVEGGD